MEALTPVSFLRAGLIPEAEEQVEKLMKIL